MRTSAIHLIADEDTLPNLSFNLGGDLFESRDLDVAEESLQRVLPDLFPSLLPVSSIGRKQSSPSLRQRLCSQKIRF